MRGCLLALLPVLALALSGETDTKCSLSGHVTNALSGEPLKKATLHLRATYFGDGRPPASPPSNYFAVSENDGSFRFLNVKPGIYSLSAEHAGFLETNYGAKKPGGSGQSLSLDPGHPISDMAIALQPEGIITGRVLDRDGDPLSTGMVTAFAKDRSGGKAGYIRRN
ncbi:MAG: carboxypeptidase regulatory-like domain-containing protein, partial [Acidobacteriaceae bacterium]|nr:carboxypeptidase regulatory-like domain-containing protein [Acidobacteriaceae bacterium]